MQESNILEKARKLGFNGDLHTIANELGVEDLEELDQRLDSMLQEQEVESLDDNNVDNLNDVDQMPSGEEQLQDERPLRFGEKEHNAARDENGKYDKNYYANKQKELDEKVDKAKQEKNRDYKKKDPKDDGPVKADGSNVKGKNKFDKAKDNINLAKAKTERFQNRLNNAKDKTYKAMHPGEALKDKAKDAAKDMGKKAGKAAAKAGKKAAKAAAKVVASGAKALLKVIASNPYVLAAVVIAAVLLLIIILIFGTVSSASDSIGLYGYEYVEPKCTEIRIKDGEYAGLYTLEEYIAGVVQSEVGGFVGGSRNEAAKAGAVAARSYVLTHVDSSCEIENSTRFQTYKTPSDAAKKVAEETRGLVLVDSSGNIASTQYDAFCTEIPQTDPDYYIICQKDQKIDRKWVDDQGGQISAAWKDGSKTQAHGNGMSQWGAAYLAEVEGYDFKQILSYYYDQFELKSVYKSFILANNWTQEISAKTTSTIKAQILNKPLNSLLSETQYNELNNLIYDTVMESGVGTREALVAAAVTPIKYLAEYHGVVIPYTLGGGHYMTINSSSTGININKTTTNYYGMDPDWGTPISHTYDGNYYNKYGPDCSSFVPWVYKNAGINLPVGTASGYVSYGTKHSMGGDYVAQPGDLLANSGHVTMVVGVDESNSKYYIAHASGGSYGTIITPVAFNYSDYYIVEMTNYISEHKNENYETNYKNGVLAY